MCVGCDVCGDLIAFFLVAVLHSASSGCRGVVATAVRMGFCKFFVVCVPDMRAPGVGSASCVCSVCVSLSIAFCRSWSSSGLLFCQVMCFVLCLQNANGC
jgi:hypothetical protein